MRAPLGAAAGWVLMLATTSLAGAVQQRAGEVCLTLVVTRLPATTPGDAALYVASNVLDWRPEAPAGRLLRRPDGSWEASLCVEPGTRVEYKVTRGSWKTVEKGPRGEELPNRGVRADERDMAVRLTVAAWADQIAAVPPHHTLTANVTTIDAFPAPELGGTRRVWVYLPPGYAGSERRYPVLYMQDGQNLFDVATSYAGEWEIDESLDALAREGRLDGLIVAGVDNGGDARLDEYSPWRDRHLRQGGKADAYVAFLVQRLKPHIDRTYRTRPGREHTGIAGSSMGGLISLYAGLQHPEVFGRIGAFSPTLGFAAPAPLRFVRAARHRGPQRVYLDMGGQESGRPAHDRDLVALAEEAAGKLRVAGFEVHLVIDAGARHHESAWAARFPEAVAWLFSP